MRKLYFEDGDMEDQLRQLPELELLSTRINEICMQPLTSCTTKIEEAGLKLFSYVGQETFEQYLQEFISITQKELQQLRHHYDASLLKDMKLGAITNSIGLLVMHDLRHIPSQLEMALEEFIERTKQGKKPANNWLQNALPENYARYLDLQHYRNLFCNEPLISQYAVQEENDDSLFLFTVGEGLLDMDSWRSYFPHINFDQQVSEVAKNQRMPFGGLMSIVIDEFVRNAVEANSTCIRCIADIQDDFHVWTIEDNGPGIPEHIRKAIFEEGGRGITTKEHGTGFGIACNKDLIEVLGGKVSAEQIAKGGTRIRILFPLKQKRIIREYE